MARRLVNLTLDTLDDLVTPCAACVFWELDHVTGERARRSGSTAAAKQAWVSETMLEWGCCGQVLYVDGVAVGHALYAPPAYLAGSAAFATAPVAADAVLLTTVRVAPEHRGAGYGRMLVQAVAGDVTRRGIRAVEAFGRSPGLLGRAVAVPGEDCLVPVQFLLAVGFRTVRPHATTPRLRLDVRSLVSWREDVESALERLWGSVKAPAVGRP